MIRLITGNPGSGKSLRVVSELVDAAKLANRPIYTNITGLTIPGVQVLPEHADWTLLPDRSLVVFDECQDIEDPDGKRPYAATGSPGLSRDHRLANLRQHRKREFDLWFIAQHPSFVHHDIRKITDEHVHMLRTMGLKRATAYTFTGSYCASPEKPEERRRGDKENWRYPAKVFGLYHSANGHHIKFKMPRKLAMVGAAVIATCALGVWFLLGRAGLGDSPAFAEAAAGDGVQLVGDVRRPPPAEEFAWTDTPRVTPIAGCAVLTESCRCWDVEGRQLALTHGQCLSVATRPLPLSFVASSGSGPTSPAASPAASSPPPAAVERQDDERRGIVGARGPRDQVGPAAGAMGAVW